MGSGFTCRGFLERPSGPRLVLECLLNEISSLRLRTAPHFARKTPPLGAVHFAHVPSLSNELAKGLPCRKNPCCLRSHLRSSPFALSHLVRSWLRRPAPAAPPDIVAGPLVIFEGQQDVGTVLHPGSAQYDGASGTYTVSGSGENMWFATDDFHFVWAKVSGDVALTADIAILGSGGDPHRKAVLMIRQTLDGNSAAVDVALHGVGLTSLQFRDAAGGIDARSAGPRHRAQNGAHRETRRLFLRLRLGRRWQAGTGGSFHQGGADRHFLYRHRRLRAQQGCDRAGGFLPCQTRSSRGPRRATRSWSARSRRSPSLQQTVMSSMLRPPTSRLRTGPATVLRFSSIRTAGSSSWRSPAASLPPSTLLPSCISTTITASRLTELCWPSATTPTQIINRASTSFPSPEARPGSLRPRARPTGTVGRRTARRLPSPASATATSTSTPSPSRAARRRG